MKKKFWVWTLHEQMEVLIWTMNEKEVLSMNFTWTNRSFNMNYESMNDKGVLSMNYAWTNGSFNMNYEWKRSSEYEL